MIYLFPETAGIDQKVISHREFHMNHTHTQESFPAFGLSLLFKILIATAILYPAYSVESNSTYYIRLVLPNILIVITLVWYLLFCPRQFKAGRAARIFSAVCMITLILYNAVSYYFNGLYGQWYWDQVNYTVGVLFFLFLILCLSGQELKQMNLLRFFFFVTVISTLCCFFMFHKYGLQSLNIRWDAPSRNSQVEMFGIRCSWLFPHKSQYALVLLMSIFLVLRRRRAFSRQWIGWGIFLLLLYGLYICDTMSAFGGLVLGIGGMFLDYLRKKGLRLNKYTLAGGGLLTAAGSAVLFVISRQRNLGTLGARIPIWTKSLRIILENPAGIGQRFGTHFGMQATETLSVDNCHNVFLNHALRFSIPAGILFMILILLTAAYAVYVSRSFFALGSWLGILILMNMDQALNPIQFAYFILLVFFIYLYEPSEQDAPAASGSKDT